MWTNLSQKQDAHEHKYIYAKSDSPPEQDSLKIIKILKSYFEKETKRNCKASLLGPYSCITHMHAIRSHSGRNSGFSTTITALSTNWIQTVSDLDPHLKVIQIWFRNNWHVHTALKKSDQKTFILRQSHIARNNSTAHKVDMDYILKIKNAEWVFL